MSPGWVRGDGRATKCSRDPPKRYPWRPCDRPTPRHPSHCRVVRPQEGRCMRLYLGNPGLENLLEGFTPIYFLYRDVPPNRVSFPGGSSVEEGIQFVKPIFRNPLHSVSCYHATDAPCGEEWHSGGVRDAGHGGRRVAQVLCAASAGGTLAAQISPRFQERSGEFGGDESQASHHSGSGQVRLRS